MTRQGRRAIGACARAFSSLVMPVLLWAGAAAAWSATAASAAVSVCTLVLTEHRTQRELLRAAWPSRQLQVSFVHSVLGTPVHDLYQWRQTEWVLVEEQFQGQGYGLAHAAGPGEQLIVERGTTRLILKRTVMPLVIRPVQDMRITLEDGRGWTLIDLSPQAIELRALAC